MHLSKAVLPKYYARPTLDKQRLGELIPFLSGRLDLVIRKAVQKIYLAEFMNIFLASLLVQRGKGEESFILLSQLLSSWFK